MYPSSNLALTNTASESAVNRLRADTAASHFGGAALRKPSAFSAFDPVAAQTPPACGGAEGVNRLMLVKVIFNSLRMSQILITYFRNANAKVNFSESLYQQAASSNASNLTASPIIADLVNAIEQEQIRRRLVGKGETPSREQQLAVAMDCNRLLLGIVNTAG